MLCHVITQDGWTQRKVKGIIICTAPFNKAAEIGISAETVFKVINIQQLQKSSGGYARIQDEKLIGDIGSSFFNFKSTRSILCYPSLLYLEHAVIQVNKLTL